MSRWWMETSGKKVENYKGMRAEKEPLRQEGCTGKVGRGKSRCEFNDDSCNHPQWEGAPLVHINDLSYFTAAPPYR